MNVLVNIRRWLAKQEANRQARSELSDSAKRAMKAMDKDLQEIKNYGQVISLKSKRGSNKC